MTQLAPDSDPTAPARGDAELVADWWSSLRPGLRRQLLPLGVGEALPRSVATELWRRGVNCPLTLVSDQGRLVRRALPPPALLELLARERAEGNDPV
jgi:hypothetical protein